MLTLTPKFPQAGSGQQLMSKSPTGVGITCGNERFGTLFTFGIPFTTRVKGPTAGGKGDWPFRGETKLEDKISAELLP
jgi:hypothetical protein